MRVKKIRIRTPKNYLIGIEENNKFYVAINLKEIDIAKLIEVGFTEDCVEGEQVLPSIVGNISKFNADGSFEKLIELPMETRYRDVITKDWHGNDHYHDVPYKRYQRRIINAQNVELRIITSNNEKYVVSPILTNSLEQESLIKHIMNLFLECFSEFVVLKDDLLPVMDIPIIKLNWVVLPQGDYPWERAINSISPLTSELSEYTRELVHFRFRHICKYTPQCLYVGKAGFSGYIVFSFPDKGIHVLESLYTGNATYVFGDNWKDMTQLTKKQVLDDNLQIERFEHRVGWVTDLKKLFA